MGGNELTRRLISIHSEGSKNSPEEPASPSIATACACCSNGRSRLGTGHVPGRLPRISQLLHHILRQSGAQRLSATAGRNRSRRIRHRGLVSVLVFRRAASKLKNWTENASGALTVAALLGCVGILVHSFLDFNLQIPANAALFYVLCAIAASAPLQESQRRRVLRRHSLSLQPNPETPHPERQFPRRKGLQAWGVHKCA